MAKRFLANPIIPHDNCKYAFDLTYFHFRPIGQGHVNSVRLEIVKAYVNTILKNHKWGGERAKKENDDQILSLYNFLDVLNSFENQVRVSRQKLNIADAPIVIDFCS